MRFVSFSGYGFAWFRHETCWGSAFSHALPKDLFLGLCRSVGDVLDVLLSFSIRAFRRRRFESFSGYGFARLRHETCWGSAFSHALPKDLFLEFCLVACRLPVFVFLFSGFQRQRLGNFLEHLFAGVRVWRRFESFAGHGFAWLRQETCWGSSVSDAVLSGGLLSLISLVRSVGDVSKVFLSDSISLSHYLIISAFRR